ncbi:MATE family efflux transporter [Lactococcus allomyrinae]|uniref:Probable multidrug resistance protein NorM n=1 Tax=Lactococcus allomyrinae TaxID=2419773 RepID=A0A387BGS7_9LACT|nr:MATE family efflux transporter [Lactococcus allomyrinae]AYG01362.1 hypothetical protein D7I46_09810 [Lactococcus allomyrinae]
MQENLFKEIQRFALPLMTNNFLQLIINQLILFLAVNRSIKNLAGITTIQSLLYALGGILGVVALAFNIEGGQALGKSDEKGFLQLIKSSLIVNMLIGIIFALITLVFGRLFLSITYAFDGKMLETATVYLLIQSPYIFLTLMMFLSANLIKIQNKTNDILVISLVSTALEILLNLILVRMINMGIIGASIASILALLVMVFLQFWVVRHKLAQAWGEKAMKIKQLLRKSVPLGGQEILEGVIFTIFFEALIARLGVTTLAIYGLCAQALNIIKMPTYIYENAVTIFGSKAYGEADFSKIFRTIKIAIVSSAGFYFIFSGLILLNAKRFAALFSSSEIVARFPIYLLIALVCSIFFISYEIFKGILQAMNLEKFVLRNSFVINLVMFLTMLACKLAGVTSFILLFTLYGFNLLVLSLILIRKLIKEKIKYKLLY